MARHLSHLRRPVPGVVGLVLAGMASLGPIHADAAATVFLSTPPGGMQCANVFVASTPQGNKTVWSCAGATDTNASPAGMSAGIVVITATTPAGPTNCAATGTSAFFTFSYVDAFGVVTWSGNVPYVQSGVLCQTNYGASATAIPVTADSVNTYVFLDELCQFSIAGPLGGAFAFGEQTLNFDMDSATGCVPRS